MDIGKLNNNELESLILSKFKKIRGEVECSPKVGIDCARVHVGDTCVLSSDPITAAANHIGYLTVHVNCNDAAAAGAEPVGLMITLLAPPSVTKQELSDIADDIAKAAHAANVDIIGGHTEITDSVTRIITSATVIAKPVSSCKGRMCEGDKIIMTKTAGLEGSAVIASDYADKLDITESEAQCAQDMLNSLSVIPEGLFAAKHGAHAMHDITEGGVLGALWEMAYASGLGCVIDIDAIPIHDVTKKICQQCKIDPYRLLSSGSMLISCPDDRTDEIVRGLEKIGIRATVIGTVTTGEIVDSDGNLIAPPEADELYNIKV